MLFGIIFFYSFTLEFLSFQFIPKFPSESNDDWLFKISPFKFLANQRYAVSVSATVKLVRNSDQEILNTASASAQVTVDVRPSGVKAERTDGMGTKAFPESFDCGSRRCAPTSAQDDGLG